MQRYHVTPAPRSIAAHIPHSPRTTTDIGWTPHRAPTLSREELRRVVIAMVG